jgi:dihydrofolate reductase
MIGFASGGDRPSRPAAELIRYAPKENKNRMNVTVSVYGPLSLPPHLPDTVTHSSESPRVLLERLSTQGVEHVYVDGGNTIQGFLAEALIDHITITTLPVILGDGIPLFTSVGKDIKLAHARTRVFDFGFVQTTYSVRSCA